MQFHTINIGDETVYFIMQHSINNVDRFYSAMIDDAMFILLNTLHHQRYNYQEIEQKQGKEVEEKIGEKIKN